MDLTNPVRSVIPSAHGAVLVVLARAGSPLSGRRIADLTGVVSQSGTQRVLGELVESGIVLAEDQPPARLYRLNHDHVAAEAITALASLRTTLLERMRDHISRWEVRPVAVWLFGSAARGDGSASSDLDVFVVRADDVDDDDLVWQGQLAALSDRASLWSGNSCEVVDASTAEVDEMVRARERLVLELRRDAITLFGQSPSTVLERARPRS